MQLETIKFVATALSIVGLAVGCGGTSSQPISSSTQPATQPVFPIVYTSYINPEPLSDAQLRKIHADIDEVGNEYGRVWFVFVRYNRSNRFDVDVYYEPAEHAGRVRRGKVLRLDSTISIAQRRQIAKRLDGDMQLACDYVQVIPTPNLDSPSAPPAETQMPFSPPEHIGDSDLLRIIDAAEAARPADAGDMPLQDIRFEKETIHVRLGWQAGLLNGQGRSIELKRDGASFKVIAVSAWIS